MGEGLDVCLVLGTRPEVIKLAGVAARLGDRVTLVETGQHWDDDLYGAITRSLELVGHRVQLEVSGRSRGAQIGAVVSALTERWEHGAVPDAVVVQGDTNSVLAGAVAANAVGAPLVHVEAGLRSGDRAMPEEHNRVVTDHLADLCLAPTEQARANLLAEGIAEERIVVTGNTVVDAVRRLLPAKRDRHELLRAHGLASEGFVLATFHRPENVDDPERYRQILDALADLGLPVVLPLHPRSRDRARRFGLAGSLERIHVCEPLDYPAFLALLAESAGAVSDSGGVQEEVSVVKRPLVVVRRSTERPEVLGTFASLVTDPGAIGVAAGWWMDDPAAAHERLALIPSPYGDGDADRRCADAITTRLAIGH